MLSACGSELLALPRDPWVSPFWAPCVASLLESYIKERHEPCDAYFPIHNRAKWHDRLCHNDARSLRVDAVYQPVYQRRRSPDFSANGRTIGTEVVCRRRPLKGRGERIVHPQSDNAGNRVSS